MFLIYLLLFLSSYAQAVTKQPIEIKFRSVFEKMPDGSGRTRPYASQVTSINVGTNSQKVQVALEELYYNSETHFNLCGQNKPGHFQFKKSKTFKKVSEQKDPIRRDRVYWTIGTDNIQAGFKSNFGKTRLNNEPLYVGPPYANCTSGEFYLTPLVNGDYNKLNSSLFKGYKENIAVIAFEKPNACGNKQPGLILNIGQRPAQLCKNDWHYMDAVKDPDELYGFPWLVKMDSVQIGNKQINHSEDAIPMLANFGITGRNDLFWHPDGKEAILKELGGWIKPNLESIPCTANKNIVYKVGGFNFKLEPKHYLDKEPRKGDESRCHLNEYTLANYYNIPSYLMYDKCLLLDFDKKRVGLASRK